MYQRILVPVDGSPTAQRGLIEAIDIAKLTQGQIRLIHVIDELAAARARSAYSGFDPDWIDHLKRQGLQLLRDARSIALEMGIEAEIHLHSTPAPNLAEVIAADAAQWKAELVVVGTHGRHGIARLLMGSCAESILRSANVPVLLVRTAHDDAAETPVESVHVKLATGALTIE